MLLLELSAAVALGLALQSSASSSAQPMNDSTSVAARAVRADGPLAIDGRDDDAAWRAAPVESDFRQFEPNNDADPSLRTEFRVVYDDRNLYFHVRAHDPHPDSIMRALSRRDVRGPSDQIIVVIDSYFDRRTGFEFAVNPDGVKRDFALYNDGNEDSSWNAVWEVATVVDSLGWAAEFRIPLSQLRYADAQTHTFGLGITRDIERYREKVTWPLIDRDRPGLASQLGTVDGLVGLTSSRSVELTSYTVAKSETRSASAVDYERANTLRLGADLKFRITPNLTLDATVNPDFGQVEADPAVLNLTAIETFLSERRPFFVEGTGVYRFALNCYIVVDCSTNEGLFYSRRIGREPYLRNTYGDATTPTATPIAAATKLTGRTRGGLSFGLLDAVTLQVDGADATTVEPRTNFLVFSAEQDLRGGEAGIRLIATGVNRGLDEWTRPHLHSSAYATGLSVRNRMFDGNYEVAASFAASRVEGSSDVIARTQRNAVHYFQQPDDELEFDPTRTSLTGHSEQLKIGKYGGGITRFETSFVRHSAGFDVNDLGFLRRADQQDWSTWASLRFNTPGRIHRWAQLNANHWQTWTTSGLRLQHAVNLNAHLGFHNNWDAHMGGTVDGFGESFCDRCSRGGPALRRSRGFFPWFGVNADSRRILAPSMWVNLGYGDEGHTRSVSLRPELGVRISTALQARIGANFARNENHTQWLGNFTDDTDFTHYAFARLEQRTTSLNLRLNYTAAPDVTFEFYAEPFISKGTYSDFRELSDTPGAASFDARFVEYSPPSVDTSFRFRQLRTNAVARWEFLPGSTVFLVWAHGRQASGAGGEERSWTAEYRDLFELHPDNTFLVKVAYWFNR
jgi:hypothetical protein